MTQLPVSETKDSVTPSQENHSMKRILIPSILVATILVGGVLAYAIWKAQPVSAQDYFSSGKKYFDQGKYQEAQIEFSNAVQKDVKNRDAVFTLL